MICGKTRDVLWEEASRHRGAGCLPASLEKKVFRLRDQRRLSWRVVGVHYDSTVCSVVSNALRSKSDGEHGVLTLGICPSIEE